MEGGPSADEGQFILAFVSLVLPLSPLPQVSHFLWAFAGALKLQVHFEESHTVQKPRMIGLYQPNCILRRYK